MKRYTLSMAIPLLALLVLALPAQAAVRWCKTDPIVKLNGQSVQILVAVPDEYEPYVNGPVEVVVKTPHAVSRELVFTDSGFNGHGEAVEFEDLVTAPRGHTFLAQIRVRVPVDESALESRGQKVPVQLTVITDDGERVTRGTHEKTSVAINVTSP